MFLNKNNLDLTQGKLDSEGKVVIVNDVELPPWCNSLPFSFITEMRNNLEKNSLTINKWIDLIFGSLQRGEKAEENHNIYMAHTYEGMVKIDSITDYDSRNALMRLWEVGVTPKQILRTDSKKKNEKTIVKGSNLYESKNLHICEAEFHKYEELIKKCYKNKSINKEYEEIVYPKIIKIKAIGLNELLLVYNLNYIIKLKFKKVSDKKYAFEEKTIYKGNNFSSKYASSYLISHCHPPIILYNNNKYMIKGGFWEGKLEINSLNIEQKEKEKNLSNIIYIKEGPIIVMEMTKDEKKLLCGTKTGHLICFSVDGLELEMKNNIFLHNDEITSISINDNLNMFATSSLDGYINIHILPSFDLVRSIKLSEGKKHFYANNVFLSSSPLPCITAFISSKNIFRAFTINGELIGDNEVIFTTKNIKCPIIFNDLYYQDYLIYGTDDGRIEVRKFPDMELINNQQIKENYDIVSMDITPDKKYCFAWSKDNKIVIITDSNTVIDSEDKKISKDEKNSIKK
jgi:WD40 repeat protein